MHREFFWYLQCEIQLLAKWKFLCLDKKNQKRKKKSCLGRVYREKAEAAFSEESGLWNGVSTTQILPSSPGANHPSISVRCLWWCSCRHAQEVSAGPWEDAFISMKCLQWCSCRHALDVSAGPWEFQISLTPTKSSVTRLWWKAWKLVP